MMRKKKKGKCSNVVMCWFWQSLWKGETKGRQRRKDGTAKPLHHTWQTCNNHTQGPPADETIITTSEQDATITDDEIKGQSIEEKTTAPDR